MIRKLLRRALSNGGVDYDPYDRTVRESLAEREFAPYRGEPAPGTIGRSRLILDIIQETFPTEALTKASGPIAAIGGTLAHPEPRPLRPAYLPRNALRFWPRPRRSPN